MSLEDDEYIFIESKARELVYFLLKNDIIIYRKLIPEIKRLDSEAFENLFKGVPFKSTDNKDGYNYNVKNKRDFEKLIDKFDNFNVILEEWYKKEDYYEYLKELWIKFISIENLKNKDEKQIEESLKSNSINYKIWPQNIKNELKTLIQSTCKTRIFELKDFIDDKFIQFNNIIEELIAFKNAIKDEGNEGILYEKNTKNIILNIIGTVMMPMAYSIKYGNEAIELKEIDSAKQLIMKQCNVTEKESLRLLNEIMEKAGKKGGKCSYGIKKISTNQFYENCHIKCTEGKIDNLCLEKKAEAFLKSKAICGIHCALSFLNLGWSIYELNKTFKDYDKIKNFEKRLKEIVDLFNIHKKEIGILPENFQEAGQRIKAVLEKIRQDQKNLEELIGEILESIKEQDSRKNKSISGLVYSGALGLFGIAGAILTTNGTSLVYGISSLANLLSGIGHSLNISMSIEMIEKYRKVLNEAREQEKRIQDEIDKLINELTKRIEQEPKFDLSQSFSSISTKG